MASHVGIEGPHCFHCFHCFCLSGLATGQLQIVGRVNRDDRVWQALLASLDVRIMAKTRVAGGEPIREETRGGNERLWKSQKIKIK